MLRMTCSLVCLYCTVSVLCGRHPCWPRWPAWNAVASVGLHGPCFGSQRLGPWLMLHAAPTRLLDSAMRPFRSKTGSTCAASLHFRHLYCRNRVDGSQLYIAGSRSWQHATAPKRSSPCLCACLTKPTLKWHRATAYCCYLALSRSVGRRCVQYSGRTLDLRPFDRLRVLGCQVNNALKVGSEISTRGYPCNHLLSFAAIVPAMLSTSPHLRMQCLSWQGQDAGSLPFRLQVQRLLDDSEMISFVAAI